MIDATHDASRTSWVTPANGHASFPVQNLPLGVFSRDGERPRGGIAIGEQIFDIGAAIDAGLFTGEALNAARLAAGSDLGPLLAAGAGPRRALRAAVSVLLDLRHGMAARAVADRILHDAARCTMHLPARIGDFTDFFAGIHHARAGGMINRPENPLMPNYKYVPVAYHSRASSVRPSGGMVRRPNGQRMAPGDDAPTFGPSQDFDYELELGVWIGPGNELGEPIPIAAAGEHIAGLCLLNDWSARDIQRWESQPLGPFLAKSLATQVSPWIVTAEALAPFRLAQPPRPEGDPAPLSHLWDARDQAGGCFALAFEVALTTEAMRATGMAPHVVCRSQASDLYWTIAQMVAHHTSNGCDLRPGDLFGSGTVSGDHPGSSGCLLEMTRGGRDAFALPSGETRTWLRDGDEVIFTATAHKDGYVPIGFGECRGRVGPAVALT